MPGNAPISPPPKAPDSSTARPKVSKTQPASTKRGFHSAKSSHCLKSMHAYIKEHRHEYPGLKYGELMTVLGPQWKEWRDGQKNNT